MCAATDLFKKVTSKNLFMTAFAGFIMLKQSFRKKENTYGKEESGTGSQSDILLCQDRQAFFVCETTLTVHGTRGKLVDDDMIVYERGWQAYFQYAQTVFEGLKAYETKRREE
jgi:hypothetical protein